MIPLNTLIAACEKRSFATIQYENISDVFFTIEHYLKLSLNTYSSNMNPKVIIAMDEKEYRKYQKYRDSLNEPLIPKTDVEIQYENEMKLILKNMKQ
jgi:hypothetical protein